MPTSFQQDTFNTLIEDLHSEVTLCSLEDYPGITLDVLNQHLQESGPVQNPHFGQSTHFYMEENKLVPSPMFVYNKDKVVAKIAQLVGNWSKWNPEYGGRVTLFQGVFNIGHNVRLPDVAYTPRVTDRKLTLAQQWTYHGDPFSPSFVVEVDILTGSGSQRNMLDYKMRHEYFQHGVDLGWLIDPVNQIMIVYQRYATGRVYCVGDMTWRNLDCGEVLSGFILASIELDMVLNQNDGSSDEEVVALNCQEVGCNETFQRRSKYAGHVEWHRAIMERQRFTRAHQQQYLRLHK